MFGCIENFTFFCCRFFAYNFMLLKAIIVEKAITNATGCTIFGWCGRFFSWLFREENDKEKSGKFMAKKKKKNWRHRDSVLHFLSLDLCPLLNWHCCVTTLNSNSSIAFSLLVLLLPNDSFLNQM